MSNSERLKFGASSVPVSLPGDYATNSLNFGASSFGAASSGAASSGAAKMPGAHAATSNDMSNSERLKFGASSVPVSLPGDYATNSLNFGASSFGAASSGAASSGAAKMPGAHAAMDVSDAERLKFGAATASSSAAKMPGAHSQRDVSEAERLKFGAASASSSAAAMPGAHAGTEMSNAERLKFGTASSSSGTASMPGVRAERSSDMSHAERVKFGLNSSVGSGGSGYAQMPGAKPATELDVSNAERVKFGSGPSPGVGARSASAHEISNAERVKFGEGPASEAPGAQDATPDMSAAARLKFGDQPEPDVPGAHDETDTSAAEALKFGTVASPEPNHERERSARTGLRSSSSRGRRSSETSMGMRSTRSRSFDDHSQDYLEEEEEGIEMRLDPSDESEDEGTHQARSRSRRKKNYEANDDEEYGVEIQALGDDPYNIPNEYDRDNSRRDGETRKATDEGWRSLCLFCSCILCIVIIGLSIGLGKAASDAKSIEAPPPEVIIKSKPPSDRPTIAPTTPPEDFMWCYLEDESKALSDERYASIRSELTSSDVSTNDEFSDNASYQRKSLCWLAFGDRLELDASDPFIEQRYVLATIFYSFDEPVSLLNEGWLSGKPECQWEPMVECDARTGTVVSRLDLRGNNLSGALPKEMSSLKSVTHVNLSSNLLNGDVSEVMKSWTHLEELRLSSNNFESFPSFLNDWKSLSHFDISANGIEGVIPENLALSTQLVYLDIALNILEGPIPSSIGNMTSLKYLFMHKNALEGFMPDSICELRNGELDHLSADCRVPSPEVECNAPSCCTYCNDYDVDRNPWDR